MKRFLILLIAAIALPSPSIAHHDPNHNDKAKCTIKSEHNADYRIEMYWASTGLLLYKNEPRYSLKFSMSNGYGSDYATIQEWDSSTLYNSPKWQHSFREGGRTGEVVVFVGNMPLFAYNHMSDKEKKKVKYEGQGRVLFIGMGQAFHYLPDFKERKELYAERDGEWFKVAHNFWRLGKNCKITIPKYFL